MHEITSASCARDLYRALDSALDDIGCEMQHDESLWEGHTWYTKDQHNPLALALIEAAIERADFLDCNSIADGMLARFNSIKHVFDASGQVDEDFGAGVAIATYADGSTVVADGGRVRVVK